MDRGLAGYLQIVDHLLHPADAAGDVQDQRLLFLRCDTPGDPHHAVVDLHVHVEIPQRAAFLLGAQSADDVFGQLVVRRSGRPCLGDLGGLHRRRDDLLGLSRRRLLRPCLGGLAARGLLRYGRLSWSRRLFLGTERTLHTAIEVPQQLPGLLQHLGLSAALQQSRSDLRLRSRRLRRRCLHAEVVDDLLDPVHTAGNVEHQLLLFGDRHVAFEPNDAAFDLQIDAESGESAIGFLLSQLLDDLLCDLLIVSVYPAWRQGGNRSDRQSYK